MACHGIGPGVMLKIWFVLGRIGQGGSLNCAWRVGAQKWKVGVVSVSTSIHGNEDALLRIWPGELAGGVGGWLASSADNARSIVSKKLLQIPCSAVG